MIVLVDRPRWRRGLPGKIREGLTAAAPAALLSGLPSTAYALATRRGVLDATEAAGTLLLRDERRRPRLIAAGVVVHLAVSALWGAVLGVVLPRRNVTLYGAIAGGAIAAFDLGVVGRRYERIRGLQLGPQIADHIAFGGVVAWALTRVRVAEDAVS